MTYCRNCGNELLEGGRFCSRCGFAAEINRNFTIRKEVHADKAVAAPIRREQKLMKKRSNGSERSLAGVLGTIGYIFILLTVLYEGMDIFNFGFRITPYSWELVVFILIGAGLLAAAKALGWNKMKNGLSVTLGIAGIGFVLGAIGDLCYLFIEYGRASANYKVDFIGSFYNPAFAAYIYALLILVFVSIGLMIVSRVMGWIKLKRVLAVTFGITAIFLGISSIVAGCVAFFGNNMSSYTGPAMSVAILALGLAIASRAMGFRTALAAIIIAAVGFFIQFVIFGIFALILLLFLRGYNYVYIDGKYYYVW